MKLSIITAVLNSPEIVRRHVIHYTNMPLPDDTEWIISDDKSVPPLPEISHPRIKVVRHERKGIWTQPAARNFGVKHCTGDMLICTDIDHILTLDLIDFARFTDYDFVKLKREVAILNEHGEFIQTKEAVLKYGFEQARFEKNKFRITPHTNSFIIKRSLYEQLGGVSERRVKLGKHPNREEIPLRKRIFHLRSKGEIEILDEESNDERPMIYMFPNGRYCGHKDYNPFGLFHNLPRKTR